MRVPYSWLREVVSVGAPGWDVTPDDLEQALVRIGHEVEEVITLGPVDGPLTVGRVIEISVERHRVGQRLMALLAAFRRMFAPAREKS